MQNNFRTTGPSAYQPGTSGIQSPSVEKQFRFGSATARSGFTTPGSYSTYSTSDRFGCFAAVRMSAWAKLSRFARRFVHFKQMDFEFASWQMLYLLIQPQKVYRNFIYRKRTKDQFARDDPAFLVLLSLSLFFSSVFYAVALGLTTWGFIKFFLWVVFVDCIGVGLVVATLLWWFSNRCLRKVQDQDVEWGYCFDVHLNAFFPMLILLHVLLPIIYPMNALTWYSAALAIGSMGPLVVNTFTSLVDSPFFLPTALGNTIWFIAAVYYVYITFLGYTALPILHRTQYFLYPMTFLFISWVATITAGWNISRSAMGFYHYRVRADD